MRLAYLLCATPRSGSTLLCELLRSTGVAGRPGEPLQQLRATNRARQPRQYFEGLDDPEVLGLLRETQPGEPESAELFEERLTRAIADATTPNGVFATKLMWGYALDLFGRLQERPATRDLPPAEALAQTFPLTAYVHVTRPDKVAQAVSLWTAVQTERWRDEGGETPEGREPQYSRAAIAHLERQLDNQDRAWRLWFRNAGIEPLTVTYDELVADQVATVERVLVAAGIEERPEQLEPVQMRRQSDGRSADWIARFEAERAGVAG
jgi:trehalose 2-sulfotransferase